jgi:GNAT superfamily N-acetyltransferase
MQKVIETRWAGPQDAELIAELSHRTFYDSFSGFNRAEDMEYFLQHQFPLEMLVAEVKAPGNFFLLAYLDGMPAGYARLFESEAPRALKGSRSIEIVRLYSEQFAIGRGVGPALMEGCICKAKELEKEWVWLGVWEKNDRAIAFYRKWGFEKFGEHVFILGHDPQTDWWMKMKL